MKNKIRLLSLLMALTILILAFTVTVGATSEVVDTPPADPAPVETTAPDPGTDPTPTTPPDSGSDTTTDPTTGDGSDTPSVDPTTPPQDGGTVEEPTKNNDYADSYTNEDGSYYYDEEKMANSISNSAGSISDYTTLYDTSDFDESALKEAKWENITLNTSMGTATGAMDFSSIKDNDSKEDNGQWMIYAGYGLIAASVLGILYFIIATATYKKKLKKLQSREQNHRSREHRPRNDYGEYPTQRDYNQRYQRRYSSDNRSYSERKRRMADTAEIEIPTGYRTRR